MSFADLKRSRGNFEALQKELEKKSDKSYSDDRFWSYEMDKTGNAFAIFRFLPRCEGEAVPWVKVYSHSFKVGNRYYIENCPTSIGRNDCPVCQANNVLWDTKIEANEIIARSRKRKLSYISNVLILKDPAKPENEGKVMLYKYGMKVHQKIEAKISPSFEGEVKIDPFDFWGGCDFKLKIRKLDNQANYDLCEFDSVRPLFGGDEEKLEKLWKSQYRLVEFINPEQFKSFDDLNKKFLSVLSSNPVTVNTNSNTEPAKKEVAKEEVKIVESEVVVPQPKSESTGNPTKLDYFKTLAGSN